MNDSSKLILLLNSLDQHEIQELSLWLKSPLHNTSAKVTDLLVFLRKKVWQKEQPFPLLKTLKALGIVPSGTRLNEITPKDKQDYRKLASRLTIQIEDYLKWQQFRRNEVDGNLLLMTSLLERQLYKFNTALINRTKRLQQQNTIRDIDYCKYEFELAEMDFFMDIILRNRKASNSMKQVVDTLRISCITQLLRYYCALINFKNFLTFETQFPFKEVLLNYLESSDDLEDFTVNLYYRLLVLLEKGEKADYFTFKELLFDSFDAFNKNEIRQFFAFMTNYCLNMISKGHEEFIKERFQIYKHGLKLECWTAGIHFSQHQFVKILNVSLMLDELDWVKQFFNQYKGQLSPHVAQNTILFCQSKIAHHEQQYDLAQESLNQITQLEDFYWKLQVKVLLLKIYYDNNALTFENFDIHPIHKGLEALRINTLKGSGTKIAPSTRVMYSNFAEILKKILVIRRNQYFKQGNPADITKLETLFLGAKPIAESQWLWRKIDGLG